MNNLNAGPVVQRILSLRLKRVKDKIIHLIQKNDNSNCICIEAN